MSITVEGMVNKAVQATVSITVEGMVSETAKGIVSMTAEGTTGMDMMTAETLTIINKAMTNRNPMSE